MNAIVQEEKTMCQQCDGMGQEDLGIRTSACRKCHGTGFSTPLKRVASLLCGGASLEKFAQGSLDEPSEESPINVDRTSDAPFGSSSGGNETFDELSIMNSVLSQDELQDAISSFLMSLNPEDIIKVFEFVCRMTGTNPQEFNETNKIESTDINNNVNKYYQFVCSETDKMSLVQLKQTLAKIRYYLS